jgi:hypothetical protein
MVRMEKVLTLLVLAALLTTACQPVQRLPEGVAQSDSNQAPILEMVGRIGGPSLSVAVQGKHAFLGHSFELSVLDVSDPANPVRVSYLPIAANVIALEGDHAYVGGRNGVTIIDIAKPTRPQLLGFVATPGSLTGIAVANKIVYATDSLGWFWLFDCTDPAAPEHLSSLRIARRAEDVAVIGNLAYVASYEGLTILDLSDRTRPAPIGFSAEPGWSMSALVEDGYAYVTTTTGLATLDVSEPTRPRQIAMVPLAGFSDGIVRQGQHLLVAHSTEGLLVFSLAKAGEPALIRTLRLPAHALQVAAEDGIAYLTDLATGSLYIASLEDLAAPAQIGVYHAPGSVNAVAVTDGYAYVIADMSRTLHIVSIDEPEWPCDSGFHTILEGDIGLAISGETLVVVTDAPVLYLCDISDPEATLCASEVDLSSAARFVKLDEKRAYLVDEIGTVHILGVTGAAKLGRLGSYRLYHDVQDAAFLGKCILLASGTAGVQVVDVASPTTPRRVGYLDLPAPTSHIATLGDYAYAITDDGVLRVLDVADLLNMEEIGHVLVGKPVNEMTIWDGYIYMTIAGQGVVVVDVQNPTEPALVARYDTPGNAWDIVVDGDNIYVADGYGGLLILQLQSP